MYKKYITFIFLFSLLANIKSQEAYKSNFNQDAVLLGGGIALSIAGRVMVNRADQTTLADIARLDASAISSFDRGATNNNSKTAQTFSDVILFTGAALPLITYASKKHRHEGTVLLLMAAETFLITNGITNITKGSTERFRPFNYNPEVSNEKKLSSGSRLSFISGHASNTAAMAFFTARVATHLHPEMSTKSKVMLWTSAVVLPAAVSYLRYEAGKHFPTDLIAGYTVGAAIGYIIPTLHLRDDMQLGALGTSGLSLTMQF